MAERGDLFLGFDVGTTTIKGALFDIEGRLVAQAGRPYPIFRPAPGVVEQNPRDWTDGIIQTIDELLIGDRLERVTAVGLAAKPIPTCSSAPTALRWLPPSPGRTIAPHRKPLISMRP